MKLFLSILFVLFFSFANYAQETNCKCCTEKYNEFDFWIGTWIVTNAEGELVGRDVVNKIRDNCLLIEKFARAEGDYRGTSSNFYNYSTKQWEQVWVDNEGRSLSFKGNRIGNQMIFKSEVTKDERGDSFYYRVIWTINEDGTLGNQWETITNDIYTNVTFNGVYKKEKI
ncbi:hypothetical protein [Flavivirga algicola]|uniref:DUF1579 domain-containing protein n=1 Tax=Flavivirga algicola TaxID=2729136 RepID=A0ABX1RSK4_9FLAO|nr:hypothetical protein [Flavivirga algicola]NMH86531.1 hypothetical protein [Flavivirga algicola]